MSIKFFIKISSDLQANGHWIVGKYNRLNNFISMFLEKTHYCIFQRMFRSAFTQKVVCTLGEKLIKTSLLWIMLVCNMHLRNNDKESLYKYTILYILIVIVLTSKYLCVVIWILVLQRYVGKSKGVRVSSSQAQRTVRNAESYATHFIDIWYLTERYLSRYYNFELVKFSLNFSLPKSYNRDFDFFRVQTPNVVCSLFMVNWKSV